jgi:uncharacterized RDD family membrane protein YckC
VGEQFSFERPQGYENIGSYPAGPKLVRPQYAGYGRRTLAFIADVILPALFLKSLVGAPLIGPFMANIFFTWLIFNHGVMQGKTGQTIGKRMLGIELLRLEVDPSAPQHQYFIRPGVMRCLVRLGFHIVLDAPFLLIGFLLAYGHPYGQTWADRICHTVVMDDDRILIYSPQQFEEEVEDRWH